MPSFYCLGRNPPPPLIRFNFQEDAGHLPAWLSALQLQPGEERGRQWWQLRWAPLPFTAAQAAGWERGFSSSFSLGPLQNIS